MRGKCPKGGKHNWATSHSYTDAKGRIHQVVCCTKCSVTHDKVVGKV